MKMLNLETFEIVDDQEELLALLEEVYDTKPFSNQPRAKMMLSMESVPTYFNVLESWDGMIECIRTGISPHSVGFHYEVDCQLMRRRDSHELHEETTLSITNEWVMTREAAQKLQPGRLFKWSVGTDLSGGRFSHVQLLNSPQFTHANDW